MAELIRLGDSFTEVLIVIDGLDEIHEIEKQREQMIKLVTDLADHLPCAKIFVTSRMETDIRDAFHHSKASTIRINADNVTSDINAYVIGEVDRLIAEKKLKLQHAGLRDKIVQKLTEQADGM